MSEVPAGWRKSFLESVATLQRGFDLPKAKRTEGPYPIVSSGGITDFHVESKATAPGVVTGRYGSVGDVFYIDSDYWPLNTALWVKDFHSNDAKFVYYLLSRINFRKFSDKTGVPGVNRNDLHRIKVNVPPLSEQKKIAEILSCWDKAIETTEKLIEAKVKLKKGLMQKLFMSCGKDWKWIPLGKCFPDISDGNYSSKYPKQEQLLEEGIPFLTANNVADLRFIEEGIRYISAELHSELKKGHLKKEDILITTRGEIGKVCEVPEKFVGSNINAQLVRLGSNSALLEPTYSLQVLASSLMKRQYQNIQTGTALKQLPVKPLKKLLLPVPSMPEQRRISSILSCADREIRTINLLKEVWVKQKTGLMQKLLTGQIRVKV